MSDPVPCRRCYRACVVRPDDPVTMPVYGTVGVRAARSTEGLCLECALHWWLYTVDGLRWAVGPELLALPVVQGLILSVFETPLTIDWTRLLRNWERPWPKGWELPTEGFNA